MLIVAGLVLLFWRFTKAERNQRDAAEKLDVVAKTVVQHDTANTVVTAKAESLDKRIDQMEGWMSRLEGNLDRLLEQAA